MVMKAAYHERAKNSPGAVDVTCATCAIKFKAWPYRAKAPRIFCSRNCSAKYTTPIMIKAGNEACRGRKMSQEEKEMRKIKAARGDSMPMWKGDEVKYRALHDWVARLLGKPHDCSFCGNTTLAHRQYHWANVSGQYLRDIEDWIRLCAKCHKNYDKEMKLLNITKKAY